MKYIKDIFKWIILNIGVGLLTGYYFYFISIKEADPTFIVDPIKTTLVDKKILGRPINIVDSEGKEILDDVNSITFYFFNQGGAPLKRENILSPIRLSLSNNSKIIDFRILHKSREVSHLSLNTTGTTNSSIDIDFKILEHNDGFTGQIIYIGDRNSQLLIEGEIEGVKGISLTNKVAYKEFKLIVIIVSLIFLMITFGYLMEWTLNQSEPENKPLRVRLLQKYQLLIRRPDNLAETSTITFTYGKILLISMAIFFLLFFFNLFLSQTLFKKWTNHENTSTEIQIPKEILPLE